MTGLDRLSDRDRVILREQVADKIEELRPLIAMFPDTWRSAFENEATRWRAIANGRSVYSDGHREAVDYALAHEFLLREEAT